MDSFGKQKVALSSVFASAGLTIIKAIVGIFTGSMGVISEAAHSALDFGAALLTYFAVRESDKPADEKHQYGHGKIESISALIETFLLFITSAWIIYESVKRLLGEKIHVEATWYAFVVIIVAIVVDISRSRALSRIAKKTKSQALEADALHFSSDIWSSAVVLIGLVFVLFDINGADAIAGLVVAVFVVHAGVKLGKRTIDVLIDSVPEGMTEKITGIAKSVNGIIDISKIRVRPAGVSIFIEMVLVVSRKLPFQGVKNLIEKVEAQILKSYPEADMTISAEPVALDTETINERVHIIAMSHNLPVHDIIVRSKGKQKAISFDLEVDSHLSVKEAHKIASHLEEEIIKELGEVEVNSHIEPIEKIPANSTTVTAKEEKFIIGTLAVIKATLPLVKNLHDIKIEKIGKNYFIDIHCVFDASVSIEKAHTISSKIEYLAKEKIKNLKKVVVHSEPSN